MPSQHRHVRSGPWARKTLSAQQCSACGARDVRVLPEGSSLGMQPHRTEMRQWGQRDALRGWLERVRQHGPAGVVAQRRREQDSGGRAGGIRRGSSFRRFASAEPNLLLAPARARPRPAYRVGVVAKHAPQRVRLHRAARARTSGRHPSKRRQQPRTCAAARTTCGCVSARSRRRTDACGSRRGAGVPQRARWSRAAAQRGEWR